MGMILCFVVPGILIGLLLGQTIEQFKKWARARRRRSAVEEKKKLFIYDLRNDLADNAKEGTIAA